MFECLRQVFFNSLAQCIHFLLITLCDFEFHILPENKLHRSWLLANVVETQAALKKMSRILSLTVLHLRVHVDSPNVHSAWVVGHNTFKHRAACLLLTRTILKDTVLADQTDVQVLGQRLKRLLKHLFGCGFNTGWFLEQEFNIAAPDVERSVVLLAEFFEDWLD